MHPINATSWDQSRAWARKRMAVEIAPGPASMGAAPFFAIVVFARGLLNRLFTRAYLPGDMDALSKDALLSSLDEGRRGTLIAVREPDGSLRFDIRLQGDDETVFLTFPRHEE